MKKLTVTIFLLLVIILEAHPQKFKKNYPLVKDVYVSATAANLQRATNHRTILEINYLIALYKENPKLTAKQAAAEIKEFRSIHDKYFHPRPDVSMYDYYQSILDYEIAAAETAVKPTPGNILKFIKATSSTAKLAYDDFTNVDPGRSQEVMYGVFNFDRLFRTSTLGEAYDMANQPTSGFKDAYNTIYGPILGHTTDEDVVEILANNPELTKGAQLTELLELLRQLKEDESLSQLEMEKGLQGLLAEVQKLAMESNDAIRNSSSSRLTEQEQQYQNRLFEFRLQGVASGFSILSNLARVFGNERLAGQVKILGNAGVNIAAGLRKLRLDRQMFGATTGAKLFSSLTLMATIFTSVMDIVSMFSDPGPSPFEIISDQLKGISSQIDTMYVQMHERFDMLDNKITQLYADVMTSFQLLFGEIAEVRKTVEATRREVADLNKTVLILGKNHTFQMKLPAASCGVS